MNRKFLCFGHRGAMGYAPENTILSVKTALDIGVDFIEVDVYCVENRLVVIHDDRLDRTTNGNGYVIEKKLDYIRSLDAGNGEKIPYLEEVIDLIDGKTGLNIELKGEKTAGPVIDMINDYVGRNTWSLDKFLVSSFIHHEIKEAKEIMPEIKIGALTGSIPISYAAFGTELNAYSVNFNLEFINKKYVDDAHKRGLKVFVYTVNHPEDLQKMYDLGVDGVFTNYPDRVNSILK